MDKTLPLWLTDKNAQINRIVEQAKKDNRIIESIKVVGVDSIAVYVGHEYMNTDEDITRAFLIIKGVPDGLYNVFTGGSRMSAPLLYQSQANLPPASVLPVAVPAESVAPADNRPDLRLLEEHLRASIIEVVFEGSPDVVNVALTENGMFELYLKKS